MSRSTRTQSIRGALAALTTAALTFVVATPAVADPPELIDSVITAEYSLVLTQAATNPGWFGVDVTNTSGAPLTFGIGVGLQDPGVIDLLWQHEPDPETSVFSETVQPGEQYHDQVPNWPGMPFEFFVNADSTPTSILLHTVAGEWFPVELDLVGSEFLQIGYPVTLVPSTARAGESVGVTAQVDAGLATAEVRIAPEDDIQMHYGSQWDWDATNAVPIGSLPVTGGVASGSVILPSPLEPGSYGILVGDPVSDRWVSGPRFEFDPVDGSLVGQHLFIEAGEPRGSTPAGAAVEVSPVDSTTGVQPVTFSFDSVTSPGTTTVTTSTTGPTPAGFELSGTYYELSTTATFAGPVTVCITYAHVEDDPLLSLFHYEAGAWKDITTSSEPGLVCGETTSFSPFALGIPLPPTTYPFTGFYAPVSNTKVNTQFAGAVVPIRFGLGGDHGLQVISSAASGVAACTVGAVPGVTQPASTALGIPLQYANGSDTYWYFWQTKAAWAGSCRTFVLTLDDGTTHTASFKFVKLTLGGLIKAILRAV